MDSTCAGRSHCAGSIYCHVDAALRVEGRIVAAVNRLSEMPSIGRLGQVRGTRELVVPRTAYLAIYRIKDGDVEVLRFFHGAQQWPLRNP